MEKSTKLVIAILGMNVSGGKLPDGFGVKINVNMDFSDVPVLELARCCSAGSSARVRLQTMLRGYTTKQLTELSLTGLDIHFNNIGVVKTTGDNLMAMNREQLITWLDEQFPGEFTDDECHELYNKKHGLDEGTR